MPIGPIRKNEDLTQRLMDGESPHDLIAEGLPRTTVNRIAERLERGDYKAPPPRGKGSRETSTTTVHLTQEQIVLPSAMFMLYDHCQLIHPEYPQTKSEWLMDVVRCWGEDHAEEIGLHPMMWAYAPIDPV